MKAVATYTMHILLLFVTLSIHTTHASYAVNHKCTGSYTLDQQQDDLRSRVGALVCTRQGCSCENYTPLATEICRLLSLNKQLTKEDASSLVGIIAKDTAALIKKAPECESTVFHLLVSCRPKFGCLHKDGAYLRNNIRRIMHALTKGAYDDVARPYARKELFNGLTNGKNATFFGVVSKVPELDDIKEITKTKIEESVVNTYWEQAHQEEQKRNEKRKELEAQEKKSLV